MGAPVGNQNAAKSRVFEQAMKRACIQEDWKRLNEGVQKVLTLAADGERWALEMVRDTLDGKPVQRIGGDDENPIVFAEVIRKVVAPGNPDA